MIKTKIAKILGPTTVVLAAGFEQGIKEGMEFIIYELSDTIFDPETNESLGELELHKGRVKVEHVQDKICTATTMARSVLKLWPPFPAYHAYEELPIDPGTATAVKTELTVRVGDLVRSVF